jgi:exodeoxyribonuclease V alpha subunit
VNIFCEHCGGLTPSHATDCTSRSETNQEVDEFIESIELEREQRRRPTARPSNRLLFGKNKSDDGKSIRGTITWIAPGAQGIDGWKAGKIRTSEDVFKFVGSCSVKVGDTVRLHGAWEDDVARGRQFRVQYATAAIGNDVEAIRKLLEVDASFRQIGPKRAGYIADYLAETKLDLEEILEDPDTLTDLKHYARLTQEGVDCLVASWHQRREENLIKAELLSLGVPTRTVEHLWRSYGNFAAAAIKDNPYTLTETLDGFGIGEADKIALNVLKFDRADPRRLACGVVQTMRRSVIFKGHTWIGLKKLASLAVTELQIGRAGDHRKTAAVVDDMLAKGKLLTTQINGIDDLVVCEPRIFTDENKFVSLYNPETRLDPNPHFLAQPLEDGWHSNVGSFTPNEKQAEAVEAFSKHRLLALTGAAGCGKSACVTMLLSICAARNLTTSLAAPTGKAAKRLADLLARAGVKGFEPMTIHKMLGFQGDKWIYNEKNKLPSDVIIIDESSMIDLTLMARLIDAMKPSACLVLVGDHNQLPPIGPGAVLRDVIEGELCRVVRLQDVLRQAGALRRNATEVLKGVVMPTTVDEKLGIVTWTVEDKHKDPRQARDVIVNRYRELLTELGERGFLEVQVISPMYDGEVGIDALNKALRTVAHEVLYNGSCDPDRSITVGDKVIQTKNDYTVGLMNGDQGVVMDTSGFTSEKGRWEPGWTIRVQGATGPEEKQVPIARTEGFMLAYAISCHRFQGSEAEHVIGAVHSEHGYMLNRKLIYTMSTRASKTLLLVGDRKGLHEGARKDDTSYRRTLTAPTWLVERLAKDRSAV